MTPMEKRKRGKVTLWQKTRLRNCRGDPLHVPQGAAAVLARGGVGATAPAHSEQEASQEPEGISPPSHASNPAPFQPPIGV